MLIESMADISPANGQVPTADDGEVLKIVRPPSTFLRQNRHDNMFHELFTLVTAIMHTSQRLDIN